MSTEQVCAYCGGKTNGFLGDAPCCAVCVAWIIVEGLEAAHAEGCTGCAIEEAAKKRKSGPQGKPS